MHPRKLVNHLFHFPGIDVVAPGNDQIFFAFHDIKITIFVQPGQVAGIEPAVPENRRGLLGVLPVALHHLGPLNGQFTHLAGGQFPGPGLLVHHPGQGAGQRHAHAAQGPFALDGIEVGHRGRLR